MLRGARLDMPGTLHHVMVRGIEGNRIVADDEDRDYFVSLMGRVALVTDTKIYAWALMTNHAHILLKSSTVGLSACMRKLLTGYAIWYNRHHKRHGHVFQNRYKSIICEEEPYFLKLVSYIHLNPLRAGLVCSLDELKTYAWSGHAALLKQTVHNWQDREYVLRHFGESEGAAQRAYQDFVALQASYGAQPELTGGGLVRSAGGWSEVLSMRQRGERQFSDERILGSGEFVSDVIGQAEDAVKVRVPEVDWRGGVDAFLEECCRAESVSLKALQTGCKRRVYTRLRKMLALKFVNEKGFSFAETGRLLGISASAVNQILRREERPGDGHA